MAMMETTIRFQLYCTCGFPLEQVVSGKREENFITVKPCRACTQGKRIDEALNKEDLMEIGSVGKVNRRGVWVDERST
jgi:hypothetical protein